MPLWRSVFYYSISFSMLLSFIPLDKNDKHISLFTMHFTSIVISSKKLSLQDNEQTQRGFLVFANSNSQMDSNGKLW